MTRRPRGQATAEWLVRRACRRLPDSLRDESRREWTAELPAILHDPDVRGAPARAVRALSYAAGTFRGARRLGRAAGQGRRAGLPGRVAGPAGGWASSSRRPPVMPPLPDGVRFMAAAVVLWFTILAMLRLVPVAGSWNYLYAAGGLVCNVLMVTGIVRLIRWARRRPGRTRRS